MSVRNKVVPLLWLFLWHSFLNKQIWQSYFLFVTLLVSPTNPVSIFVGSQAAVTLKSRDSTSSSLSHWTSLSKNDEPSERESKLEAASSKEPLMTRGQRAKAEGHAFLSCHLLLTLMKELEESAFGAVKSSSVKKYYQQRQAGPRSKVRRQLSSSMNVDRDKLVHMLAEELKKPPSVFSATELTLVRPTSVHASPKTPFTAGSMPSLWKSVCNNEKSPQLVCEQSLSFQPNSVSPFEFSSCSDLSEEPQWSPVPVALWKHGDQSDANALPLLSINSQLTQPTAFGCTAQNFAHYTPVAPFRKTRLTTVDVGKKSAIPNESFACKLSNISHTVSSNRAVSDETFVLSTQEKLDDCESLQNFNPSYGYDHSFVQSHSQNCLFPSSQIESSNPSFLPNYQASYAALNSDAPRDLIEFAFLEAALSGEKANSSCSSSEVLSANINNTFSNKHKSSQICKEKCILHQPKSPEQRIVRKKRGQKRKRFQPINTSKIGNKRCREVNINCPISSPDLYCKKSKSEKLTDHYSDLPNCETPSRHLVLNLSMSDDEGELLYREDGNVYLDPNSSVVYTQTESSIANYILKFKNLEAHSLDESSLEKGNSELTVFPTDSSKSFVTHVESCPSNKETQNEFIKGMYPTNIHRRNQAIEDYGLDKDIISIDCVESNVHSMTTCSTAQDSLAALVKSGLSTNHSDPCQNLPKTWQTNARSLNDDMPNTSQVTTSCEKFCTNYVRKTNFAENVARNHLSNNLANCTSFCSQKPAESNDVSATSTVLQTNKVARCTASSLPPENDCVSVQRFSKKLSRRSIKNARNNVANGQKPITAFFLQNRNIQKNY